VIRKQPGVVDHGLRLVTMAMIVAVVGIMAPMAAFWDLYNLPSGTQCRPIGAAVAFLTSGVITPLFALFLVRIARPTTPFGKKLALAASLLSLVPFPLYYAVFRWIVAAHHLTLLR
jgi:hypothetical protein